MALVAQLENASRQRAELEALRQEAGGLRGGGRKHCCDTAVTLL
jgi:hypothetical protein